MRRSFRVTKLDSRQSSANAGIAEIQIKQVKFRGLGAETKSQRRRQDVAGH